MVNGNLRCAMQWSRPSRDPGDADPLGWLRHDHDAQLELCNALEHIADSLPDSVDRRLVGEVIVILAAGMTTHFRFEETVLFPLLRLRAAGDATLLAALDQLEDEHTRDSDVGDELVEQLRALLNTGRASNAEMLGYMLRGFFEGQRRHIEWENAILLPAARQLLTDADLEIMKKDMPIARRSTRAS